MSGVTTVVAPGEVSDAAATATDAIAPGKSHYVVLDGLRGVAALMVVMFHTFEAYSFGDPTRQIINHGYLAVDFFFLLSGFVIAYAYDDRWGRMGAWDFYKRRLIRLQPMVVLGSVIGAALFYLQAGALFPKIAATPVWQMLLVMLLGCTLLPLPKQLDIRGWDEIHPLNGPAWSLFYEYVANVAYALVLRRLSVRALTILAVLAAALLLQVALLGERRDLVGGWSLDAAGIHVGLARLCYPFLAGMLQMRSGWRLRNPQPFAISTIMLIVALALPRMGDTPHHWTNGLYDAACVLLLFPLVVAIGAGVKTVTGVSVRFARFFGALSFPLYITHYPLIYFYTAWVIDHKVPASIGAPVGVALVVAAVALAYASLKLYDEPVRRWLGRRFLSQVARRLVLKGREVLEMRGAAATRFGLITRPSPGTTERASLPRSLQIDERAAVDQQRGARDVACEVGGHEHDRPGQILRIAKPAQRNARRHARALVRIGEVVLVDVGEDRPRQHRIAADAVPPQRDRGRLHQRVHAGFGRRVMRLILAADQRRDRRHCDDRAAVALPHHLVGGGLDHIEGAVQVDPQRALECGGRHVEEGVKGADAGVADEDVDAAQRRGRSGDEGGGARGRGDVAVDGDRLSSQRADRRHDRVGVGAIVEVVDRHIGTLAGGFDRGGTSDPARSTRDQNAFSLQQHARSPYHSIPNAPRPLRHLRGSVDGRASIL